MIKIHSKLNHFLHTDDLPPLHEIMVRAAPKKNKYLAN